MSLIGFDIGNNSCVTAIAKPRTIQIVLNHEAQYETPSVVSFAEKKRHFGSSAASLNVSNPSSTLSQIKRLVGKQYSNIKAELQELPFATSEAEDGGILVHVHHWGATQKFTVVQVLAMLLSHLKKGSEKNLESPVTSCVIGVPSYFTDRERFAYLDAAEIAGLKPLKLMHEGTAVALGYGVYKTDLERKTIVVFIDIGHCHTQVTVVLFEKGGLHVLSHAYDQNLGGRDFDKILFQYFSNQFRDKYHIDIYAANPRVRTRLMSSCEKLKKVLTSNTEARLSIECLVNDIDVSGVIKREEFEQLSSELLFRVPVSCNKALTDVNLDPSKVHIVELVGSGSRIPAISSILTGYFGENKLKRTLNSSECVARGCALQCSMLAPNSTISNVYKIQDSVPFHVEYTVDNSVSTSSKMLVFPKGHRFPFSGEIKFCNLFDTFHLKLSSGIQHGVSNCPSQETQPTRTFKVGPFPVDMYYTPIGRIQISFDDHGCVSVGSASVEACGLQSQHLNLQIVETLSTRMSESGISNAQSSELQLTSQDKLIEEIQEKRNALESFIYDTRKKLVEKYRSYVRDSEKSIIYKSLEETERWLDVVDEDKSMEVYLNKFHELEKIFNPIVKRYEDIKAAVNETSKLHEGITMQRQAASLMHDPKKQAIIRECDRAEEYLNAAKKFFEMTPKCIDQLPMPDVIKSMINSFNMFCEEINTGKHLNAENQLINIRDHFVFRDPETRQANDNIFVKVDKDVEKGVQFSVTNYFGLVCPIEDRHSEEEARAMAIQSFLYRVFQNRVRAIPFEDCKKNVNQLCIKAENWLSNKWMQQDLVPKSDIPVLQVKEIKAMIDDLNNSCCTTLQENLNSIQSTVEEKRKALQVYESEVRKKFYVIYTSYANRTELTKFKDYTKMIKELLSADSLYESGLTYTSAMEELEKLCIPFVRRYKDKHDREIAMNELRTCIFEYSEEEESLHDEIKEAISSECKKAEKWANDVKKELDSTPSNIDPVRWSHDITNKKNEFVAVCERFKKLDMPNETENRRSGSPVKPETKAPTTEIQNKSLKKSNDASGAVENAACNNNIRKSKRNKPVVDREGTKIIDVEVQECSLELAPAPNDKSSREATKIKGHDEQNLRYNLDSDFLTSCSWIMSTYFDARACYNC